jgi:hypothetical protein
MKESSTRNVHERYQMTHHQMTNEVGFHESISEKEISKFGWRDDGKREKVKMWEKSRCHFRLKKPPLDHPPSFVILEKFTIIFPNDFTLLVKKSRCHVFWDVEI